MHLSGGASATLVASATSAHKKEAVEFMTFMSEHFSNYAYEEGAILPTWKYSGDMELKPFQQTLLDLMQGADGFCLAWDTCWIRKQQVFILRHCREFSTADDSR